MPAYVGAVAGHQIRWHTLTRPGCSSWRAQEAASTVATAILAGGYPYAGGRLRPHGRREQLEISQKDLFSVSNHLGGGYGNAGNRSQHRPRRRRNRRAPGALLPPGERQVHGRRTHVIGGRPPAWPTRHSP